MKQNEAELQVLQMLQVLQVLWPGYRVEDMAWAIQKRVVIGPG